MGIVMERQDLDASVAFACLRRVASYQQRTLYVFANEVVPPDLPAP
jgi:AmiR/NasT family two-component response regulator